MKFGTPPDTELTRSLARQRVLLRRACRRELMRLGVDHLNPGLANLDAKELKKVLFRLRRMELWEVR